ncbi:hypothetical protein NK214_10225 [Chromobacterium sp. S0633]|uniref:hypothetical protein n=1 Tax=Chromobacterium sp. S0633 TaxID=2957805 RepID=UPI00209F0BEF|nr:hypothetical protein [Chromobacterium sp. S0633]MCP1290564.1 hypothetical protein [Chromobacterium sp. S0633]
MENDRKEFLIQMYNQMFNDINRHIMVVWQSVGVLVGAFAIFSLVEKNVVSLDVAVSLIVLLSAWLIAHLLDAGYWYNRNLVIIANIERQFLTKDDLREIHYYFGEHRPKNRMITHLRIQMALGLGLVVLVVGYHASKQVLPNFLCTSCAFEFSCWLPYLMLLASACYVWQVSRKSDESYEEFIRNSPGILVDTTSVEYGVGHGHEG